MPNTEFLVTSLVVVLIPGTGVIYTVSTGLFHGWRASIAAACGCTAGIIPHLLASTLGLAAILHMSAIAFQFLKFAGVVYLLFLAWSMWHDTGALSFDTPTRDRGAGSIALRGFLINILNPKLSIFFMAFLPQFVPAGAANPLLQMGWLSALFMAMTLVIFILYGFCAHGMRAYVVNSPRLIKRLQRSFALVFAALGCKLALSDR
jgi:threonine/homoserine/homoserine lactone efflux protein